ncbi:MAG: RNA polymerase sigma factor [Crocinitomicaceae bacterium]
MLYQLQSEKVYNTAISYLQNAKDAEEITQDVFITVFDKITHFKQGSKLSTWMYRITINKSINFIKKRKRHQLMSLGLLKNDPSDFNHPGIQLEHKEEGVELFKQIDQLAPNQKTAFILVYIEHLPQQEVADILETTVKAVESLLQRAKTKLKANINFYQPKEKVLSRCLNKKRKWKINF